MATSQQYSLRWNNYLRHITYAFDNLRSQDDFVDVTLCCDGRKIKAHKVLLSACSGYFKEIFKENPCPHPVIIFKFIKYEDLLAIIEFMYQGEVNVQQEALQSFLQTAELLAVQGLTAEEKEKPKFPKPQIDQRIIEEQIVKTVPATIRTVTTENNTQTQTIELQANIIPNSNLGKKRKITFTDDDEIYTETVEFRKEEPTIVKAEVQYIPTPIKMDIPEYIDVAESNQIAAEASVQQQTQQQTSQDTTTQTTGQFTSEYEILAEQANYESEIEEKYHNADGSENTEITTVEMGRIFTTQTSGESNSNEKIDDKQDPTGKELQCKMCHRKLQSLAALKRHKASKHERIIKHECEVCKKVFKTKWSLSTHNSRFHRENRLLKESIKMDFTF